MNTLLSLREFFDRDLGKLREEIEAYPTDEQLWERCGIIRNPGGNLALHICGNLNHFVGAILGNSGYIRERDKEFSTTGLSRKDVVSLVEACRDTVNHTLEKLETADLDKTYPQKVFDREMTTGHFLIHLSTHLNYHLGQVNYHRRLLIPASSCKDTGMQQISSID